MKKNCLSIIRASSFALSLLAGSVVMAANNDVLWESTMSIEGMDMAGMGMPSQKICMRNGKAVDAKDAMKGQEDCTTSDLKVSGNKSSWKFKCSGANPMTGTAEMTSSPNEYTMKMKSHSSEGDMNMVTTGKKIGTCNYDTDSAEAKACGSVNQSVGDIKKKQAEQCKSDFDANNYASFLKRDAANSSMKIGDKTCGGNIDNSCSELQPKMCQKVSKLMNRFDDGYKEVAANQGARKLAGECGLPWEKTTKAFCGKQLKDKSYDNVAEFCEADARPLYEKNCVGRDYTAQTMSPYRAICSKFGKGRPAADSVSSSTNASSGNSGTSTSTTSGNPDADKANPAKAILDGAKSLKDKFGF